MTNANLNQYISEKEQLIRQHFPLFKEIHFDMKIFPSQVPLVGTNIKTHFTQDILNGFYVEIENGMQANFLDGRELSEYEEGYEVRKYMPNSKLIAISSQAILFTEGKGFCKKEYGDLDESDAVYLGFDLYAILNDPVLIEELLDY